MRFTTTLILFGALITLNNGCSDSSTSPPDGAADVGTDGGDDGGADVGTDSGDPGDTDPYELTDLDEECEGLTGQQILDVAGGSHTVPFTYAGTAPDTELTLTFTYTDGTITCQPAITQPPGVGAPDLPARVDLEVDSTVVTADGAFDEAASATLQHMGGFGGPTSVLHNFEFDAAALGGSYTPSDPALVDAIRFGGSVTESGLQGNAFEDGRSPGGAMMVAPIGSWDTLP